MATVTVNLDEECEELLQEIYSRPEYCTLSRSHLIRLCVKFTYEYLHSTPSKSTQLVNVIKEMYYVKSDTE